MRKIRLLTILQPVAVKRYCGMMRGYSPISPDSHISRSSAIIESLQMLVKRTDIREQRLNFAHFYFSFDNASGQDISTVMKSIIWQIVAERDIPPELRELFRQRYPEKPSPSDLRAILRATLKRYGGKPENPLDFYHSSEQTSETFLVFDGLDEIPHGPHREAILGLLYEISTISTSDRIHILVTSRPEKDISCYLPSSQGWLRYSMGRHEVQRDIALYVSDQISGHPKLNKLPIDIKSRIQQRLIQGSNGMSVLIELWCFPWLN